MRPRRLSSGTKPCCQKRSAQYGSGRAQPLVWFDPAGRHEKTTVSLSAAQVAMNGAGEMVGDTFAEQFEVALRNVVDALAAAGGSPTDLVSLVMYATDVPAYRASLSDVGAAYRRVVGRHFPAMALVGVTELVEPSAMIEIVATAVIAS